MTQPATRPHQRAFPPALPSFDEAAVGGSDPIQHAARVQAAAREQYHAWQRSFSPNVSPEDRRDSANFFALSDAASALPQALDAAQAHADEAQAKVDDLLEDQHVGDDVASQIAAQRVWARTQRVLDSISDGAKVGAAARDLVKNAPESELPVIAEELGAYLTSRGVPTGWLNGARAQRVPGADDVRADAALKAKRVAALRQGHNSLVKAFAAGTPAPELVDPYSPSITADDYDGRPYSTTAQ